MPVGAFFALNAVSFLFSAAMLSRLRAGRGRILHDVAPRIRDGFAALRPEPTLAVAIATLGIAVTLTSGTWIVGVPQFVRKSLHHGAAAFSLIAAAYAAGSVVIGLLLTRIDVRRKAETSFVSWLGYLPGFGLFAVTKSLPVALGGAALDGVGQSSARVLVVSAAQERIPDRLLGRVVGLVTLVHRGAHAAGLLAIAPLFAFLSPRSVFAAVAVAAPAVGLAGALTARAIAARADGTRRSRRS
jgi:hypothetical protein